MSIKPIKKHLLSLIFLLLSTAATGSETVRIPSGTTEYGRSVRVTWESPPIPLNNKNTSWRVSPNNGVTLDHAHRTDDDGWTWYRLTFHENACGTYTVTMWLPHLPPDWNTYRVHLKYSEPCPTVPPSGTTSPPPSPESTIPPTPLPTTLSPPSSPPPPPSSKLVKISEDTQVTIPGDSLKFIVELRDLDGSPIPDVDVNFFIFSGDKSRASLNPVSAMTDANGRARTTLTLATDAGGEYTVEAYRNDKSNVYTLFTVTVDPLHRKATRLEQISGDNQQEPPGTALEKAFVVEVRDQFDKPLQGAEVTFSVTSGGGTLSATSAMTDADGRAQSILTLGPNPGTNTVTAAVTGVQEGQTFTAKGAQIPHSVEIISGNEQQGLPDGALENPFVVEVRDQADKPLQGAEVTFSVAKGGGTLSVITVMTDANGRAESILTLGPNPGTNTVSAAVTGVQEGQTFIAEGGRIPKSLETISGDEQQGLPGAALENPFVVEVRDQADKTLSGAEVTFSVTSGGGTLSAITVMTDANGRAQSILTLGPNPGTNTVTAAVTGVREAQTFTAEGSRIPKLLETISGDEQQGLPGAALENPFVVEVRDQADKPLQGAEVTFSVTSGGGTLSATSAMTDADGRAQSILTLGPNPGTNTVSAAVTGVQEAQTFTAEGSRIPKSLEIISGDNRQGPPGTALEKPVRGGSERPIRQTLAGRRSQVFGHEWRGNAECDNCHN